MSGCVGGTRTAATVALLLFFVVVGFAGAGGRFGPARDQLPEGFAGSEACRSCHLDQFEAWSTSTHGTAGGPPSGESVIAPFDGRPIRFADALVTPTVTGGGTYEFVVERSGRPPLSLEVVGVIGRGHMVGGGTQGYVSRFPDGTIRFLPFDYSRDLGTWFCNTAFVAGFWVPGADRARLRADAGWLPVDADMRLSECGDWPPARILGTNRRFANCQDCHGSQIRVEYRSDLGRYETELTTLEINCESCHGPAGAHVARARAGALVTSPDLGLVALDTLGTDGSLAVCFQCHALKRALGDQSSDVEVDYSLGLPLVGDDPYLPDGRIRTFGYQQTHRSSACYLSGSMSCVDCHDPHSQAYRDPFGSPLGGRLADGQCTACHASKGVDPEAHTFHPPGSDGARCVGCHMPYLQHPALTDAVPYGRSDHSIPVPRPGFDESVGLESACARCHEERSPDELATQARVWWGELKPHRPEVALGLGAKRTGATVADRERAVTAAAGRGGRYGLAKIMAIDGWVRGWASLESAPRSGGLADGVGRALAAMTDDSDPDVAAVSAAALHVTRGEDPDVRALLDEAVATSPDAEGLRARWAGALLQWAAAVADEVGTGAQQTFLRRAQEVRPRASETLVALASGLSAEGELAEAVQVYLEALRHHPEDPVALVNLGLILEVQGREPEAEGLYLRATGVRATEAVAYLNLGNVRFRRGDLDGAIESYRRAVTYDPGLSRAHFYLGVSLINAGRPADGLPALYDALEFTPDVEEIQEIRELIRQVEAVLGR